MIQLFIKENIENNQRLTVRDDRGQILYFIEGRWGRKDDIISIYKSNGQHLITLKQQKLSPIPVFNLYEEGQNTGVVRKHPGLFGIRDSFFTIHPHKWIITGDFEELYFTAHHENELIMECDKDITNGQPIYELNIKYEKDAPLCALISTLFDHYSRKKDDGYEQEELPDENYDLGFSNGFHLQAKIKNKTR